MSLVSYLLHNNLLFILSFENWNPLQQLFKVGYEYLVKNEIHLSLKCPCLKNVKDFFFLEEHSVTFADLCDSILFLNFPMDKIMLVWYL